MTIDMVKKVISKLKFGKAAGPSGVVVEMVRAAGDTGAYMISNHLRWEAELYFVCLYKGKGDMLSTEAT